MAFNLKEEPTIFKVKCLCFKGNKTGHLPVHLSATDRKHCLDLQDILFKMFLAVRVIPSYLTKAN